MSAHPPGPLSDLLEALSSNALALELLADTLDEWARQSRDGGWSTHQVQANIDTANICRRGAAENRALLRKHGAP